MRLHQHIRRDQTRHTDDWLITYADTITLLLCLFVITLSVKTGVKLPAPEPARPIPAATQEGVFWGQPAIRSFAPITEEATDATSPAPVGPAATMEMTEPPREAPLPAAPAAGPAVPPAQPVRSSLPAVVDRLKSQGTPIVAQQGDRITTLQIGSAAFFASGSAVLSNAGKSILDDVAGTLKSSEFAAYHITIEGHTDDAPISTPQFQSNWELSAARAAAVVRYLLDLGLPAGKLTAAGYADTVPVAPNRNADGTVIPENQAKNRRVVIKLEKIDKSEQ
jgi:chemotaxis protein MotB